MLDGSDHNGNDRHDRKDRTRNAADRPAKGSKCRLCTCDDRGQVGNKLHQLADTDHCFADHDQKRTQCCRYQSDLDDSLLRDKRHGVEFINKSLNLADNRTDSRHQDFAEGNSKLLKLGFQNGDLPCKVVLHDGSHLCGYTIISVNLVRASRNSAL